MKSMQSMINEEIAARIVEVICDDAMDYYTTRFSREDLTKVVLGIIEREPPDPPGWEGGFAENH